MKHNTHKTSITLPHLLRTKKTPYRPLQIGEEVRRALAQLFLTAPLCDLDTRLMTISEVKMSSDLQHAKIFFLPLGAKASDLKTQTKQLNQASGFLRKHLGKKLSLRFIPHLHFLADAAFEKAEHMRKLCKASQELFETEGQGDSSREEKGNLSQEENSHSLQEEKDGLPQDGGAAPLDEHIYREQGQS